MSRIVDVTTSLASSFVRAPLGIRTREPSRRPAKLLELYEFEACPYCRKVREALTDLDLDVIVYPCPKNGVRYRPRVKQLGGKLQFPYLVDPNTDTRMYESDDIIAYLYRTYSDRKPPATLRLSPLSDATSFVASAFRLGRGSQAHPSREAAEPLELYSFEASPFARLVRERLTEFELPFIVRNVGRGGMVDFLPPALRKRFTPDVPPTTEKRRELVERAGRLQIPCLIDPNTGQTIYDSALIVTYLEETYAGK